MAYDVDDDENSDFEHKAVGIMVAFVSAAISVFCVCGIVIAIYNTIQYVSQ